MSGSARGGPSDTHPAAEKVLIEGYRRMTPADKMRSVGEMYVFARGLAFADIGRRYPHADEHERRMRLASRFLEPELMLKIYGWDVKAKGY